MKLAIELNTLKGYVYNDLFTNGNGESKVALFYNIKQVSDK